MKGYRKEPQKTAEAVDDDGWLHTGDILEADDDGYLKVIDRKKELIINAAGKNMSPANIENTIKAACPLIGVMLVVGDARPYNTALIVLDAESAAPYAAQRGLADASPETLAAHPDVIAEIAAGMAEGNAKLSKVEQIKRFRVLPTFWEPGGDEITLTMKLKRKPIHEKYGAEIDELYAADIADAGVRAESGDERGAMNSRHVSVWIDVAPDVAYAIAADPEQLPRWASGLAAGGLRQTADGWVADSPMGQVIVEFAPANDYGVLDHVVRLPSGEAVYNPLRVIPAGEGQPRCEVVFTVRRRPGMADEEFESDVMTVAADLDRLRRLAEG